MDGEVIIISKNVDEQYSKVLLRLSALLYVDATKINNLNQDAVLTKIVESIFVGNNNSELSARDISSIIKTEYKMNFDEKQILGLILNNINFKTSKLNKYSEEEKKHAVLNLDDSYFRQLCIDAKPNHFEMIIGELFKQNKDKEGFIGHTKNSVSNIIHKFIYNLFAVNFEYFRTLADESIRLDNDFLIELSKAKGDVPDKPDEIEIINAFLSYEDNIKNKMVFDIATLAFEYCITIGSNTTGSLNSIDYLKKHFYLDTNILFRALGMNGEYRSSKILSFLKKCFDNGQKLYITDITMKEFHESLDYNIYDLSQFSSELDIDVYDSNLIEGKDLVKHYLKLKKTKSLNPYQYKDLMLENFENIISKYDIIITDTTELYTPDNIKIINSLTNNLVKSTESSASPKTVRRAKHDASNYFLLKKQNDSSSLTSKDTLYKFITSDSQLISWERNSINLYKNICLKPTDWLAFLLRYISTTDDDFESFVGFLKLNSHRKSTLDETTIRTIMNAVTHTSLTVHEQNKIISNTFNNELNKIKELQEVDDQESISKLVYDEALTLLNDQYTSDIETSKVSELELLKTIEEKEKLDELRKEELNRFHIHELELKSRNKELENQNSKLGEKLILKEERKRLILSFFIWTIILIPAVCFIFKGVPKLFQIKNDSVGTNILTALLLFIAGLFSKIPNKCYANAKRMIEIKNALRDESVK